MLDWKKSVCGDPQTEIISNVNQFVEANVVNTESPIDYYYSIQRNVLTTGTSDFLDNNSVASVSLLVSLVSNTEYYFRNVFGQCIKLCPLTRVKANSKQLSLSSIYFGSDFMERGIFEHQSLSDSEMIKKALRNIIGINNNVIQSQLDSILQEFQKICELRHSAAHSINILASKNAVNLGLPPTNKDYSIKINYANLQKIAAVLNSLIRTVNNLLFEEYVTRWASSWREPDMPIECNHDSFKAIWNIFHSSTDLNNGSIPTSMTLMKVKNLVIKDFEL